MSYLVHFISNYFFNDRRKMTHGDLDFLISECRDIVGGFWHFISDLREFISDY